MKPIAPNTLIQNRYLIVHLIGKGGMGEVYLAVDQRLGSAVALKRTFFSDDAMLGTAFEREARTLARLRHAVLPKVSDHFIDDETQYLVMEHISGEDIAKRLETNNKPFPISWVLFWADQLLDALNYLHTHEPPIIHRDIKPQNLKLTDDNHIVLLDFGLSKNSVGETRVTTAGSVVGYTPHYAPMEQIRGTGTDARSDVYSLSATLYQILTNIVPFDALTRADNLINGMPDPLIPINELNREVSAAVSDVILKGMTVSQEQRYKTAREMQKALRDAYAQMQTGRLATPAEFNAPSPADLPQSPQKTAELSGAPLAGQMTAQKQSAPPTHASEVTAAAKPNGSQPAASGKDDPDFEATMRYDSAVPEPAAPKQASVQTEVLPAGSSAAITSAQKEDYAPSSFAPSSFAKTDDYADDKDTDLTTAEDAAAKNDFGAAESYVTRVTAPSTAFDKTNAAAGATQPADEFDSVSEPVDDEASADTAFAPSAAPLPPKSSRKGLAIGGLFALLLLAVGAAGIGWLLLRGKEAPVGNVAPTPAATATATVAPTPAPTLEAVTEINSSITNTSTNSEIPSSDSNGEANSNVISNRPPAQTNVQTPPVRTAPPRTAPPAVTTKPPVANKNTAPSKKPRTTDIEQ